jgi:hypothetical protein
MVGICLDVVLPMKSENQPRSNPGTVYSTPLYFNIGNSPETWLASPLNDAISDMDAAIWVSQDRGPGSHIDLNRSQTRGQALP